MQKSLFQYCRIDPISFWHYTPAETRLMILAAMEEKTQEYEYWNTLEARLCAVVYNANGVTRKDKKPFEIDDFMPNDQKKQKMTPELLEKKAMAETLKMGGKVNTR